MSTPAGSGTDAHRGMESGQARQDWLCCSCSPGLGGEQHAEDKRPVWQARGACSLSLGALGERGDGREAAVLSARLIPATCFSPRHGGARQLGPSQTVAPSPDRHCPPQSRCTRPRAHIYTLTVPTLHTVLLLCTSISHKPPLRLPAHPQPQHSPDPPHYRTSCVSSQGSSSWPTPS